MNPIIFRPSKSIDEYRELTFVIGSPIVFHTAPPHPASNARIICSPQFVGGALASQNGFKHSIPANLFRNVDIAFYSILSLHSVMKYRRCFPVS